MVAQAHVVGEKVEQLPLGIEHQNQLVRRLRPAAGLHVVLTLEERWSVGQLGEHVGRHAHRGRTGRVHSQ